MRNSITPPWLRSACALVLFAACSRFTAAQAGDTIRAGAGTPMKLSLPSGVVEDHSFLENNGTTVPGPKSTKETRVVSCGKAQCYLVIMASNTPRGVMVDSVWADNRTFELVRHVESGFGNHKDVRVEGGRIRGVAADSGKPVRTIDEVAPAYDFSVVEELLTALPLKAGYRAVLHTYDVTQGYRDVGVHVIRLDTLQTARGPRAAWQVELAFGTHEATRWLDRSTGEGLKWSVDMGGGRRMWGRPPE